MPIYKFTPPGGSPDYFHADTYQPLEDGGIEVSGVRPFAVPGRPDIDALIEIDGEEIQMEIVRYPPGTAVERLLADDEGTQMPESG